MEFLNIVGATLGVAIALIGCYLAAAGFINRSRTTVFTGVMFFLGGLFTIMTALERIMSS